MRTTTITTCAALVSSVAFVLVLTIPPLSPATILIVSNVAQLLAAVGASLGCAVAWRRTAGPRRRAWALLSAGTGAWAGGQLVWTIYEVGLRRPVPFPSLADVGFLAFPVLAAAGLLLWLGAGEDQLLARGRDLMDGVIIALSITVISWVTVLAPVVEARASGSAATTALALAYPIGDLILGTLVLLHLARAARSEHAALVLLAVGLGGVVLADSLFVYRTGTATYTSADLVTSVGWFAGFAVIGAAGLSVRRSRSSAAPPAPRVVERTWPQLLLPYVSLVVAGATVSAHLVQHDSSVLGDVLLGSALIGLVLGRQLLALVDNHRLVEALAEAGGLLEHQALHDTLTGLPNRALFADRLDHALQPPSGSVSVLFCDLDDFKVVNDELGHEAGDALLQIVARRLLDCVRSTDTVARLGGDEFAILLGQHCDAARVAERVVASMHEPAEILGRRATISISVGVARHDGLAHPSSDTDAPAGRGPARRVADADGWLPDDRQRRDEAATLLLRMADRAMYAAKGAGKGRAVLAAVEPAA